MKILLCGAGGFIGRHLFAALRDAGHDCIAGVRQARQSGQMAIDYARDLRTDVWLPRLADVDVVINAIGVLRDTRSQPMDSLHARAPAALFNACKMAGVKKVIHVSALGVGTDINTHYFRSKLVAEQALIACGDALDYLILRPSVVYGKDGASARMFRFQARLPVHTLPMGGVQMLQPVHINDIAEACVRWLDSASGSMIVDAVGADAVSMREMLDTYRQQMGHGHALHIPVPAFMVKLAAKAGDLLPMSPLSTENLAMLDAGSTADSEPFSKLLERRPLSVHEFLAAEDQISAK